METLKYVDYYDNTKKPLQLGKRWYVDKWGDLYIECYEKYFIFFTGYRWINSEHMHEVQECRS